MKLERQHVDSFLFTKLKEICPEGVDELTRLNRGAEGAPKAGLDSAVTLHEGEDIILKIIVDAHGFLFLSFRDLGCLGTIERAIRSPESQCIF